MRSKKLIKNKYGFYQVKKPPSLADLNYYYKKKNYSKIENLISKKDLLKIKNIISEQKKDKAKNKKFHGNANLILNLNNKNDFFYKIIFNKKILKICFQYFKNGAYKKDRNIFQFDHMHARILMGKSISQNLHIDSRICGVYPPTSIHFFIYLDKSSKLNGATTFVKGSHLIKRFPENKDKKNATSVDCNPGDAIVLNSSVWHGSGQKNTPGERTIITLVYTRWFISQQFAIPYSIKNKNKFTKKQKYLLGFYNYAPKNEKQRQTRRGNLPKY